MTIRKYLVAAAFGVATGAGLVAPMILVVPSPAAAQYWRDDSDYYGRSQQRQYRGRDVRDQRYDSRRGYDARQGRPVFRDYRTPGELMPGNGYQRNGTPGDTSNGNN